MTSVYVKTLGCKVNTFDSQVLENQFRKEGYAVVDSAAGADIAIVNTCSVTANAEKEARYWLRRFRRENPSGMRIVTGCYAQINSARLAELDDVDFVVPNEAKERLVTLVGERLSSPEKQGDSKLAPGVQPVLDNKQGHFKSALTLFDTPRSSRTRAFVKIQDGCNGFCAYCQIPYARGASRSVPPDVVLTKVGELAREGVSELVFTGIHIGDYGEDLSPVTSFSQLLAQVLGIEGIKRLRISSLEPAEVSREMLELLAAHSSIVCDHFHLPLQSGHDRILHLMRRKYTTSAYAETLRMIREYFPQAQISADVICGFPGESEDEFRATMAFIESCGLGSLHVFPYSARPNTAALRMPGHLPPEIIKTRVAELKKLSHELHHRYASAFIGSIQPVLWEGSSESKDYFVGKTPNYLQVCVPKSDHPSLQPGSISPAKLMGFWAPQMILAKPELER